VLKALMGYLGSLFTAYRDDIESFLLADKDTGEEVLFDLRRFAEQRKQDRKQVCVRVFVPGGGGGGGGLYSSRADRLCLLARVGVDEAGRACVFSGAGGRCFGAVGA
jgi:hypothetical protein